MLSDIVGSLTEILKENDEAKLEEICLSKENETSIGKEGWEIITLFMNHLKETRVDNKGLSTFSDIFLHIARLASAKELLLGILEQFDPMVELDLVELLFPALQVVGEKLAAAHKKNHCYNLNMIFTSLIYYGDSINLPNYDGFDPLDDYTQVLEESKACRYVEKCVSLAESLFAIIRKQHHEQLILDAHLSAVKGEFMSFCCGLLERLSLVNLPSAQEASSESESKANGIDANSNELRAVDVACRAASFTISVHNPWSLIQDVTWQSVVASENRNCSDDWAKVDRARACLLYLLTTYKSLNDLVPQVIGVRYAFVHYLPSVVSLMWSPTPTAVHKGLELCRFLNNRLERQSLTCAFLDERLAHSRLKKPARSVLKAAVHVATRCSSRTLRQRAAQLLLRFIDKLEWSDRYSVLRHLLSTEEHSGVLGYLIVYLKDNLAELLKDRASNAGSAFLKSRNFDEMLWICLRLPDGAETDLLREYDRLMAAANLVRFLLIRDSENKTGIWDQRRQIAERFLRPIRTDIDLSKMHFSDELKKQTLASKQKDDRVSRDDAPVFTVGGINLPDLPPKNRIQMLESAVHSFDVMQGVCVRVQELMDSKSGI